MRPQLLGKADGSAWIDMGAEPPVAEHAALSGVLHQGRRCLPARRDHSLPRTHIPSDVATFFGQLAALKAEIGLTERYRIEGWRAGRE